MPLLPAVVPVTTEKRSERVPARLAANVAPLFGVASPTSPFGAMTWLCDFSRITISEIARGAPSLSRTEAAAAPAAPEDGWTTYHRAVLTAPKTTLPNEIVNATTNRFGPHTKAAVVLTACNVLLEPAAQAMAQAFSLLRNDEGGELPTALRIVAWASAAIEVYRSQPALVIAASKARMIQRESLDSPRFPIAEGLRDLHTARCELGNSAKSSRDAVTHPRDLHFLDQTVRRLRLPGAVPTIVDLDSDDVLTSSARDLGDELVDRLLKLLIDAGEPDGVGHVWISERAPDHLVAEAMLPASGLVEDLLEYWSSVYGDVSERPDTLTVRLPAPADFGALPELARRALALSTLGILRHLRPRAGSQELPRADFFDMLDRLDALTCGGLDEADPAAAVVHARVAVLRIAVLRHDIANPLREPLNALQERTELCLALVANGTLDRGACADVLSAACVELNAVRWTNTDSGGGSPNAAYLDDLLRRYWATYGELLELDLATLSTDDSRGVGHHLHNYAAFLGSHTEDRSDLVEAVRLFQNYVIPSRRQLHMRTGSFAPLGRTYYVATGATTRLAEQALATGRTEEAVHWATLGSEWIRRVLESREFNRLQTDSTDQAGLFALRAASALVLALELGVLVGKNGLDRIQPLLDTIDRWIATSTRGKAENYVRHQEVELIRKRVAGLSR